MLGHFRQICFISSPALHVASPRPVACDETARAAEAVFDSLASEIPGREAGRENSSTTRPSRGRRGRRGGRAPSGRMGPLFSHGHDAWHPG